MSEFSLKHVHPSQSVTILELENPLASARISLFGGQVLSYRPKHDQRERLFMSDTARFDGSKSIRGGIPVCWPWFGAHPDDITKPSHGFARTMHWRLIAINNDISGTRLLLGPEAFTDESWSAKASLELEIIIGNELIVTLTTRNIGSSPFPLGAALHSYFSVLDIDKVVVQGLHDTYSDKTRNWNQFASPAPYHIKGETDRIHLEAAPQVSIVEADQTTTITSAGHDSIVVWNPWKDCAARFPDLTADSYQHMLCIETALTQGFIIEPGKTHHLQQKFA